MRSSRTRERAEVMANYLALEHCNSAISAIDRHLAVLALVGFVCRLSAQSIRYVQLPFADRNTRIVEVSRG